MASRKDRKIKGNQNSKEKRPDGIMRFLITYFLLMGVFFFVSWFKPILNVIDVNGLYTQSLVVITTKILAVLGVQCTANGSLIALPTMSLDVKFGCNGLEAVLIYAVAVAAYPATWKKKIIGIAAGFVVLQSANIVRLVLLVYAGIYTKDIFEFIHIYIAQGIMIVLSLGLFFIYLNHAKNS